MTQKKSRTQIASAVSLALASMMLSAGLSAGIIENSNPGTVFATCGTDGDPEACIGAWNLDNVKVDLIRVETGEVFGTLDESNGVYPTMTYGDSFRSYIRDTIDLTNSEAGVLMGRLSGKDWPVGEPTGIKAINADPGVKTDGTPPNCLINTSYLGADGETTTGLDQYLNTTHPEPVICSSPFQTHKRYKVAMLAASADGTGNEAIDLVFDVKDSATINPYQVFSKINNYTDKRLAGYKIVVGRGVGSNFKSASELNIADQLYITLGRNEETKAETTTTDLFTFDQLATFSHGLFGPAEPPHFPEAGFFDDRTAGFEVAQTCFNGAECTVTAHPETGLAIVHSDTIYSTVVLPSNYATLFGDWLPSIWAPSGVFFDDDGDPTTDAVLRAWWDGDEWRKGEKDGFAVVSTTEFNTWATSSGYSIDVIEDVLNLGPNYIVHVGDGGAITVRIIPVVATDQTAPAWFGTTPTPLPATAPVVPVITSSGGGGCAVGGNGRFDPTLPALLAMGLGFFGWRRFKAGK